MKISKAVRSTLRGIGRGAMKAKRWAEGDVCQACRTIGPVFYANGLSLCHSCVRAQRGAGLPDPPNPSNYVKGRRRGDHTPPWQVSKVAPNKRPRWVIEETRMGTGMGDDRKW